MSSRDLDKPVIVKPVKQKKVYTRYQGDPDEHVKTQQYVAKLKKSNLGRRDHQVSQIKPSAILTRAKSHETKIFNYRDRIMPLLQLQLNEKDFELFDLRSNNLIGSMSENTEIAIFSDLLKLVEFCHVHESCALPLPAFTFDQYLSALMAAGYKRNTLDRHIASIVRWHNILEMDDPRKSFEVSTRIGKIRQQVKLKPNQKEGLRVEHLAKAMEILHPAIPRDVADIALLFVAFDTLCRRSELVQFEWEDLVPDLSDGSGILKLHSSKTDKEGEGAELYVKPITMKLLEYWRAMSTDTGKIFRGIYSNNTYADSLSAKGVERCYKRIAERLGFPSRLFAGHSTRIGAAQEMAAQDIPMYKIMLAGRWTEVKTLTNYMKRINAKKSGSADLNKLLYRQFEQLEDDRKLLASQCVALEPVIDRGSACNRRSLLLHLRVEKNQGWVRNVPKVRRMIENELLSRYQMNKVRPDGWEYRLTVNYDDEAEFGRKMDDLIDEMADLADRYMCFIEHDLRDEHGREWYSTTLGWSETDDD